jgi:hypothetical protein
MDLKPGTATFVQSLNAIAIRCRVEYQLICLFKIKIINLLLYFQDGFIGFKKITFRLKLTANDFNNGYIQNKKNPVIFESIPNTIKENITKPKVEMKKL